MSRHRLNEDQDTVFLPVSLPARDAAGADRPDAGDEAANGAPAAAPAPAAPPAPVVPQQAPPPDVESLPTASVPETPAADLWADEDSFAQDRSTVTLVLPARAKGTVPPARLRQKAVPPTEAIAPPPVQDVPEDAARPEAPAVGAGTWDTNTAEYRPVTGAAIRASADGDPARAGVPEPRRSRIAIALVAAFLVMVATVTWLTRPSASGPPTAQDTPPATLPAPVVPVPASPTTAAPSATPSASPSAKPTATPTTARRPTTAPPTTRRPTTAAAPPGPAAPQPASLSVGARRSLRLASGTNTYVIRASGVAALATVTTSSSATQRRAATFTIVAGLADNRCYSFRADNGAYLRHENYRVYVEVDDGSDPDLFRKDATFCVAPGGSPGARVFRTQNYPKYHLHARGGQLWIDDKPPTADSSFVVTTAWG
ncbi:AbfB domain-containing protein [Luedemannella helvata]|uniref:Alpha-L-arabinofuranosidase B arabinose-binding domain-containing protein n=1 Tax=Luedemannella helvata TaxID=349315 RepID=A0ABN2L1D3_9ACTN